MYVLKLDGEIVDQNDKKYVLKTMKKYHNIPVWVTGNRQVPGFRYAQQEWIDEDGVTCPDENFTTGEPLPANLVSVIEFKLCFTAQERAEINALMETDPIVAAWMEVVNDPRCTEVDLNLGGTQSAVEYLIDKITGFTQERAAAVLKGQLV